MSSGNLIFGRTQLAIQTPFDNTTAGAVECGFTATEVQTAIEEACSLAPGTTARFVSTFANSGNTKNAWLERFHQVPSNTTPFVLAEPASVKALALSVKNNSSATAELYKNGVLVDSLSLVAGTTAFEAGLSIILAAGDQLSAKINNDDSCSDPAFQVFIQVDGV